MALRDVVREAWQGMLDDFSSRYQGAKTRLEVVGTGGKQHVITESAPFEGISADLKDGEDSVSVILDAGESMMTHIVSEVKSVQVDELDGAVSRIEIASGDGTTTVLSLH